MPDHFTLEDFIVVELQESERYLETFGPSYKMLAATTTKSKHMSEPLTETKQN